MTKGESPMKTGISDITGRMVRIRHANEYDGVFIEKILKAHDIFTDEIDYRKFVIATDNGLAVGCGQLKQIGENPETSCVIVAAENHYSDIEPLIVSHLIEFATSHTVYIFTNRVKEYEKIGFRKVRRKGRELDQASAYACRKSQKNATLMAYRK
ncbi:MAG: hypothetical protein AB1552_13970 [Nitrospirota bacterium]